MPNKPNRKVLAVYWTKAADIQRWEQIARALGYENAGDCIRGLAEEARAVKVARLENQSNAPLAAVA